MFFEASSAQTNQSTQKVAWLKHNSVTYFARSSDWAQALDQNVRLSAVHNLVQGLFQSFGDQSFFKLRNRIMTDEIESASIAGLIDVVAKRLSVVNDESSREFLAQMKLPPRGDETFTDVGWYPTNETSVPPWLMEDPQIQAWADKNLSQLKIVSAQQAKSVLDTLAQQIPRANVPHDQARAIAAILCDLHGNVKSWAVNSAQWNKTAHAELKLLQKHFLSGHVNVPAGWVIYTSLQCCRMCAGYIWDHAEDKSKVKVLYGATDPGRMASNTVLQAISTNQIRWRPRELPGPVQLETRI